MRLFLLTFFLIYGGVHAYFFARVRAAFAPGPAVSACLVVFLTVMVLAPILIRLTERGGYENAARVLAYMGYGWLGFLFLFFCASLVTDLYRLLIYALHAVRGEDWLPPLSNRSAFFIAISYAFGIAVYGFFEALNIRTERVVIESPRIPADVGRIRLVQISDVHLGLIVRNERFRRIVSEIRRANPDMLVSTGDLVDGQIDGLAAMVDGLREIKPRYGKYAVTGNHEYYAGIDQALDFTRKAGFTVLEGTNANAAGITIAGVSDPTARQMGLEGGIDEKALLSALPREKFTILLKHRPVAEKESIGMFDLQLSGHIHKGQIFPFNLVVRLFYPAKTGFSRLQGSSALYVGRGTGTWGPPIRFLAPPEITVVDLVHGGG